MFGDLDDDVDQVWNEWIAKYNKQYLNEDELRERKSIWERNLAEVKEHNEDFKTGKFTYRISLTQFSDRKNDELPWMDDRNVAECYRQPLLFGASKMCEEPQETDPNAGIEEPNPESFDWRDKGCVTPVKDQGTELPACWIFSAVAAVESHHKINNGELVKLSEQQLVDCDKKGGGTGDLEWAFDYIGRNGLVFEHEYPFIGKRTRCRDGPCRRIGIKGFKKIKGCEKELENVVAKVGPVAVSLVASNKSKFHAHTNYEDIFYDPDWEKGLNPTNENALRHTVLVVGYGKDQSKPRGDKYWIIKNSWGVDDDSGFKKIAKDRDNNCFVSGQAIYPVGVGCYSSEESQTTVK